MRKYGLDICRIFACMMVVMIHTVMLFWEFDPNSPTWAVYNLIAVAIRCSVPLFFMISGALLLDRDDFDFGKHLHRMLHLLELYLAWAIICGGIDSFFLHVWFKAFELDKLLLMGYYHLWYLPATLVCYAFIPFIRCAVKGDKFEPRFALAVILYVVVVWNISLLSSMFKDAEWLSLLSGRFALGFTRYLVYTLLGWFLYEYRLIGKKLALLGVLAASIVLLYAWINRQYSIGVGEPSTLYYDYMSPAMILLSAFVFSLCLQVEKLPRKLCPLVEELSACTLGIYLVHPLFISALKSLHLDFTQFNTFLFFPACYISFVLLSLLTSFVLRRIPIVKKLVS